MEASRVLVGTEHSLSNVLRCRHLLRSALGACDLTRVRAVSRSIRVAAGELKVFQHKASVAAVVVSASTDGRDDNHDAARTVGSYMRTAHSSEEECGQRATVIALGSSMRRCLGLVRCTARELRGIPGRSAAVASACLARLDADILNGFVRTISEASAVARAGFVDATDVEGESSMETAVLSATLLREVASRLETGLLFADVPEFCCARVRLPCMLGPAAGHAVALHVDLDVECEPSTSSACQASFGAQKRWLWVEVHCVGVYSYERRKPDEDVEDVNDVDIAARVRVDMNSREGIRNAMSAIGSAQRSSRARVSFQRQVVCSGDTPKYQVRLDAELLRALEVPHCELLVSVRADWPLLHNAQLRLHPCKLTLCVLTNATSELERACASNVDTSWVLAPQECGARMRPYPSC